MASDPIATLLEPLVAGSGVLHLILDWGTDMLDGRSELPATEAPRRCHLWCWAPGTAVEWERRTLVVGSSVVSFAVDGLSMIHVTTPPRCNGDNSLIKLNRYDVDRLTLAPRTR